MDSSDVAAQTVHRAAARVRSRALSAASVEIRQESRAAIEDSKAAIARARVQVARLRETRRIAAIARTRGKSEVLHAGEMLEVLGADRTQRHHRVA